MSELIITTMNSNLQCQYEDQYDSLLGSLNLPNEILFLIFKKIPIQQVLFCRRVCKELCRIINYRLVKDLKAFGEESIIVWRISLILSKKIYVVDEQERIQQNYDKFITQQNIPKVLPITDLWRELEEIAELVQSDISDVESGDEDIESGDEDVEGGDEDIDYED